MSKTYSYKVGIECVGVIWRGLKEVDLVVLFVAWKRSDEYRWRSLRVCVAALFGRKRTRIELHSCMLAIGVEISIPYQERKARQEQTPSCFFKAAESR